MSHQPVALCTTSQLAERLAVDPATVRRWIASGRIKPAYTTPGGHHRFRADILPLSPLPAVHDDSPRATS